MNLTDEQIKLLKHYGYEPGIQGWILKDVSMSDYCPYNNFVLYTNGGYDVWKLSKPSLYDYYLDIIRHYRENDKWFTWSIEKLKEYLDRVNKVIFDCNMIYKNLEIEEELSFL